MSIPLLQQGTKPATARVWLRPVLTGLVMIAIIHGIGNFARAKHTVVPQRGTNPHTTHAAHPKKPAETTVTVEEQAKAAASLRETQTQVERLKAQGVGS